MKMAKTPGMFKESEYRIVRGCDGA